ncbi:helix-turn-helix transcriptional regulator [Motilimonas cestriensis]|uniref:helix-turn-helix transcriptional regulator n=1 Tax=Motilimonas cestriensis TaxID=2742685 RepID=UPI003DA1DA6A
MPKIKFIRGDLGVTQRALAEKLGLSQSTINHYENGNRSIDTGTGWKIVQALNAFGAQCSFEDVFPNPQSNSSEA